MSQLYLYIIIWQFPYRSWYHTHSSISILVSYSEFHIGPGIILRVPYRSWYHTLSSISVLVLYSESHIGPGIILKSSISVLVSCSKFHIGHDIILRVPYWPCYHTQSSISDRGLMQRSLWDMTCYDNEYIWKWRD